MPGQGLGSLLLEAVGALAAAIEGLSVTAVLTNTGAHRFYERHGFCQTEIVFVVPDERAR
jgi:GNAT superfamily N-acetyltransferase